jgi:hypothetical protein
MRDFILFAGAVLAYLTYRFSVFCFVAICFYIGLLMYSHVICAIVPKNTGGYN